MTDERRQPDLAYDTDPGSWVPEDDVPTEVDPETEQEREEESRKVVAFFENFLRSLDLKHLRERRERELVRDCNSNARDFVAYTSAATAPPRATKYNRALATVLLEPGMGDRTAPTVVLPSIRPSRWPLGVFVMAAGVLGVCWLLARSHSVASAPQASSAPSAKLVQSAWPSQPLEAIRPVLPAENATPRAAEPASAVMTSERPWQKKSERAAPPPVQTSPLATASSTPSGSDPVGARIMSW